MGEFVGAADDKIFKGESIAAGGHHGLGLGTGRLRHLKVHVHPKAQDGGKGLVEQVGIPLLHHALDKIAAHRDGDRPVLERNRLQPVDEEIVGGVHQPFSAIALDGCEDLVKRIHNCTTHSQ